MLGRGNAEGKVRRGAVRRDEVWRGEGTHAASREMVGGEVFETLTVSRAELAERPEVLKEVQQLFAQSKVKIVDIHRERDRLTIVFRRVTP
ncbi:MAG: hypothetical protein K6T83_07715 [Alicyclobacillus sp.]|nr:hypothetical protein [Alicyclobacillus sp.]